MFRDLQAAHFWRITPGEFWAKPIEEQTLMLAFMSAGGKMRSHEDGS